MPRMTVLRGMAALLLAALTGCAAPAGPGATDAAPEVSRRVSECDFRVVVSRSTGLPDARGEAVLDEAAAMARRTGTARINPTYSREEAVNDFAALNAVARVHGESVRAQLAARGVAADSLPRTVLVSHPQASRSGAYVRVCAPFRNVENGWRQRPADPDLVLRVTVPGPSGGRVLHVPILNLGPYTWNNLPVEELRWMQVYLDRADDPATFAEVQSRCSVLVGQRDAACARVLQVTLQDVPLRSAAGPADASGRFVPVSRRVERTRSGEPWAFLVRRWPEDGSSIADINCQPFVQPNLPAAFMAAADPLVCRVQLTLGAAGLSASLGFTVAREADALAVTDRARRDLLRFAGVAPGR